MAVIDSRATGMSMHVLSKKFVGSLTKHVSTLRKLMMAYKEGGAARSALSVSTGAAIDTYFLSDSSKSMNVQSGSDIVPPFDFGSRPVNEDLLCSHGQPKPLYSRSAIDVSHRAWRAIQEIFPGPCEIPKDAPICSTCSGLQRQAASVMKEERLLRGEQTDKCLHALRTRRKCAPPEFDDPAMVLAPTREFVETGYKNFVGSHIDNLISS